MTGLGLVGVWVLLTCAGGVTAQQQPRFDERVDVTRLLVDVRVVDHAGVPIRGLGLADFEVRVGGKPARLESVQWVGGVEPGLAPPVGPGLAPHAEPGLAPHVEPQLPLHVEPGLQPRRVAEAPAGRLVVFLFQKSLVRGRISGLMRMLRDTPSLFGTFTASDRIAVLSFDSRLTIWLDFTHDLARVRQVFDRAVLFGEAAPSQQSFGPSLLSTLTPAQARRTHSIEEALQSIAEALAPLPGAKSLVMVGHGFGELGLSGVTLRPTYDRARAALQAARTSVFSLDVTEADYHSLEKGLQVVAEDTGGFFARTHLFPAQALARLEGALAGHYVLFVEQPPLRRGAHAIDVRLKGPGTVLASRSYSVSR